MTRLQKVHLILTGALALLLTLSIVANVAQRRAANARVVELQNQIALKDKTIEIKEGLYHKLALELKDLRELLDRKDLQEKDLLDQLKKSKQELFATNKIVLALREQLVRMAPGTQTEVPPPKEGKPARTKVDFHHDFGFVTADGWTMTNPPESWLRLNPGKPLSLSVSLAQGEDKTWHSYVTSDNKDVLIDVKVAAVNPYVFKPHWYEGIGVNIGLGMGTNQSGLGALVSVGLNYKIKQFTVGPNVWLGINEVVDKYYGVTFEWRPFEKVDR